MDHYILDQLDRLAVDLDHNYQVLFCRGMQLIGAEVVVSVMGFSNPPCYLVILRLHGCQNGEETLLLGAIQHRRLQPSPLRAL